MGNFNDFANALKTEPPQFTAPFSYFINTPRQEISHSLYKLKSSAYVGQQEFHALYALQVNERTEFDIRRGMANEIPSLDLKLYSHSFDLSWNYLPRADITSTIGVQLFAQDNDILPGTGTLPFVPNYNSVNAGLYSIHRLDKDQFIYELGMRYDFNQIEVRGRDSFNEIFRDSERRNNATFNLGLLYKMTPKMTFRTNIGSAWRPPKVGELFSFGKHQFVFEYGIWRYAINNSGNISTDQVQNNETKPIKSERGVKWIGAFEIKKPSLLLDFVLYANFINNFFYTRLYGITNDIRGTFPAYIYQQTTALLYGADMDLSYRHDTNWSSEFKIAYLYARDLENTQYFLEMPPFRADYNLSFNHSNLKLNMYLEFVAHQNNSPPVVEPDQLLKEADNIDRSRNFDFIAPPSGYFLLDLGAEYRIKRFTFYVKAQNVLNTSYRQYTDRLRYFADDIGRNIHLSLKYNIL